MRTRAQESRDAALRRLTLVNHSLAAAAVIGVGVVTDIVAHIPFGHTHAAYAAPARAAPRSAHSSAHGATANASAATSNAPAATASAPPVTASAPPVTASAPPAVASAPPVVVSGGS